MALKENDKSQLLPYAIAMKDTVERRREILELVATGLTRDDACEVAGIHRASLYRWLKDATYATQLTQAEMHNKLRCMTLVQNAGKRNWRAAAWWLERKYPLEFSMKHQGVHDISLSLLDILANPPSVNVTTKAILEGD